MHKIRYLYKGSLLFSSHDQIADFIIQNKAQKVLDIGCYMGFIGQTLRTKGWPYNIIGIDKDKDCQIVTKNKKYNAFLNIDIEKDFDKIHQKFDAIILADVLEHLNNPQEMLLKAKKILNDNGKIYISLPNIANIFIRSNLLLGNFNYQNYGILDKDHRFFYTLKTARKLIKQAGLTIIKTSFTPIPAPFLSRKEILKKPLSVLYLLARMLLLIRKELFAYQFIFVCE